MIIGEFCDTYPPQLDGVGRVTLAYCQTLTAMGHETYYVGPESPDAAEVVGYKTLLSASVKMPRELYHIGIPWLDRKFQRQIAQIPFDIVHAHSPFLAADEAQRIARRRDIPLVTTFHSKYYDDVLIKTHSELIASAVVRRIIGFSGSLRNPAADPGHPLDLPHRHARHLQFPGLPRHIITSL